MKKNTQNYIIKTMEDIKRYEHVSSSVSEQYVPIKTSDFVKELSSVFTLKGGRQYRYGSTAHYVMMGRGENTDISLYIENSFDRTCALRLSFRYNDFIFGRVKQVHRGKPAHDMVGSIEDVKTWYTNASRTIQAMRTLDLEKEDIKNIAEMVFKSRKVNLRTIVNFRYNHPNALAFVEYLIRGIKEGTFIRKHKDEYKTLRPMKQASLLVTMNAKIWNYLSKNNPELYI